MADYQPYAGIDKMALSGGESGDLLFQLLKGMVTLPKRVIDAAATTAPPGLRREDYTDVPAPQGGAPFGLSPQAWQPGDEQRAAALETAGVTMGATPFGMPGAGGAVLGAGPIKAVKAGDELAVLHNTRAERLAKADELGGLAVPSTAIVKPAHGFNSFGDVSLIADPSFVKPGRNNPVFASDVYSPTFPSLNDAGDKIFRGFTDMGNRRYAPLTLDNLVREMKGNVRGGEHFNYGAGSVRSAVTPQFRNMKEIEGARDKIITKEEFAPMKEQANSELVDIAEKFRPYSKYSGGAFAHTQDFANMLGEYAAAGLRPMSEHYRNLPPELMEEARGFLRKLRDMPTEYFEAKPQRAVRIGEFKGAVVPESEMAAVAPILDRNGISRVEPYAGGVNNPEARRAALMKFRDLFFAGAPVGLLAGAASREER